MSKKIVFIISLVVCFVLGICYKMSGPSVEKMVGQMIMTGFHGDGEGSNPEAFRVVVDQIKAGQIGGVILFDVDVSGLLKQGMTIQEAKKHIFSSNIKNVAQVKKLNEYLQSVAPVPLLIAIDQEGGEIQRLKPEHGFKGIPSAKELRFGLVKDTYNIANNLGKRLKNLGFNVDFAPLLDVDVNPNSPAIGAKSRSFSPNPKEVSLYGGAFAKGLADAGVVYSFKHFPGHGSAGSDTHEGLTDITKTYKDYELEPWRDLLKDVSEYATVMVAHVVNQNFDNVPASLSKKTIGLVRDMGFDGVIVSDDMDMGAIVNEYGVEKAVQMAIDAGNDILVFGNNLTFDKNRGRDVNAMITRMVKDGRISKSRIKESYDRIMKLKKNLR